MPLDAPPPADRDLVNDHSQRNPNREIGHPGTPLRRLYPEPTLPSPFEKLAFFGWVWAGKPAVYAVVFFFGILIAAYSLIWLMYGFGLFMQFFNHWASEPSAWYCSMLPPGVCS